MYLIITGEAFVHDVEKVHRKITAGKNILVPGYHLADQPVGLQFPCFVLYWQHGGLRKACTKIRRYEVLITKNDTLGQNKTLPEE